MTSPQDFHRLRKERGVTQDELHRLTGISPGTISTYERGRTKTNRCLVDRLWEALLSQPDHHTLAEAARSIQWRNSWGHARCAELSGISEQTWNDRIWRRKRVRKPHPATTEKLKAFVERWGKATSEVGSPAPLAQR